MSLAVGVSHGYVMKPLLRFLKGVGVYISYYTYNIHFIKRFTICGDGMVSRYLS